MPTGMPRVLRAIGGERRGNDRLRPAGRSRQVVRRDDSPARHDAPGNHHERGGSDRDGFELGGRLCRERALPRRCRCASGTGRPRFRHVVVRRLPPHGAARRRCARTPPGRASLAHRGRAGPPPRSLVSGETLAHARFPPRRRRSRPARSTPRRGADRPGARTDRPALIATLRKNCAKSFAAFVDSALARSTWSCVGGFGAWKCRSPTA